MPDGESRVVSRRNNVRGDVRLWCPRASDLAPGPKEKETAAAAAGGDGDRAGGEGGAGGAASTVNSAAKYADALRHFQWHWSRGHPVLVREIPTEMSWEPNVMERAMRDFGNKQFGGRSDRMVPVVNCTAAGAAAEEAMTPHDFFKGFTDASVFSDGKSGDPLLYKLKDWPSEVGSGASWNSFDPHGFAKADWFRLSNS